MVVKWCAKETIDAFVDMVKRTERETDHVIVFATTTTLEAAYGTEK